MRFHRPVLIVLTALALGVSVTSGAAAAQADTGGQAEAAASTTRTSRIWHWNVAGSAMHRGAIDTHMPDLAVSSIVARAADFVSFNELCFPQYREIQRLLVAKGWPQTGNYSRWAQTKAAGADGACNGEAAGLALFSKAPLGTAMRLALTAHPGQVERRHLLCAPLSEQPHQVFCTTHITNKNDVVGGRKINEQQLDDVRERLEQYERAGDTVIIAGDFNAQPNYGRLNNWYARSLDVPNNSGNTGFYRELDDTDGGCPGYGETSVKAGDPLEPSIPDCNQSKKIDLIFVRENRIVGPYSADTLAIAQTCSAPGGGTRNKPCSDHRITIGLVTVSVTV